MDYNKFLADRLREFFLNGQWIANTNYKDQIVQINWEQATFKFEHLNSIASLVFHINYYLSGLIKAFENGKLEISDKYSFDMPLIDSEAAWQSLLSNFIDNAQQFSNIIETMDNSTFEQPFIEQKYGTYLRNIEGVLEHGYYHLGQISLIKKLVLNKEQKIENKA